MINYFFIFIFLFTTLSLSQEWEVYTPENSALESTHISEILVDNNNVVWIATGSGLAKFENDELTLLNNSNSILPTQNVTDLFIDNNNLLWVLFGDKNYRGINSGFELNRNDIGGSEIVVNTDGQVYIGSNKYLVKLSKNNSIDTIFEPNDYDKAPISSLLMDKNNNIWIKTSSNFGDFWKITSNSVIRSDSLGVNVDRVEFNEFKLDKIGNIWLVGTRSKLIKYDVEKELWYDMNEEYSLDFEGNIFINNLAFDKDNNIHFITTKSYKTPVKLYSYNGNEFEISIVDSLYPQQETFPKLHSAMAFDDDNNLYLVSDEVGIFKLNANTTSVGSSYSNKIKLYPNPAKSQLNFDLGDEVVKTISITDLTGKEVITYNYELNNLNSIDISNLITGHYFISFELTDKSVINKKFVKE